MKNSLTSIQWAPVICSVSRKNGYDHFPSKHLIFRENTYRYNHRSAQNGPILTRYWSAFQRRQTKTAGYALKHVQRRALWSPAVPGTKVLSLNQRTRTQPNLNAGTPSDTNNLLSRKIRCWCPVTKNGQAPRFPNYNLPHQHYSPNPLKTLNLGQWVRWMWGTIRSPVFSIDKLFLTPNS